MNSNMLHNKKGRLHCMSEDDLELALEEKKQGYYDTKHNKQMQRRKVQLDYLEQQAMEVFKAKMGPGIMELNKKWERMDTKQRSPYHKLVLQSGYDRVRNQMLSSMSRREHRRVCVAKALDENIRRERERTRLKNERTELKKYIKERKTEAMELRKIRNKKIRKVALNRKRIEKIKTALYREAKERTRVMNRENRRQSLLRKKAKKLRCENAIRLKKRVKFSNIPKTIKHTTLTPPRKTLPNRKTKVVVDQFKSNRFLELEEKNKVQKKHLCNINKCNRVKCCASKLSTRKNQSMKIRQSPLYGYKVSPRAVKRSLSVKSFDKGSGKITADTTFTKRQQEAKFMAELREERRLDREAVKFVMRQPHNIKKDSYNMTCPYDAIDGEISRRDDASSYVLPRTRIMAGDGISKLKLMETSGKCEERRQRKLRRKPRRQQ